MCTETPVVAPELRVSDHAVRRYIERSGYLSRRQNAVEARILRMWARGTPVARARLFTLDADGNVVEKEPDGCEYRRDGGWIVVARGALIVTCYPEHAGRKYKPVE